MFYKHLYFSLRCVGVIKTVIANWPHGFVEFKLLLQNMIHLLLQHFVLSHLTKK